MIFWNNQTASPRDNSLPLRRHWNWSSELVVENRQQHNKIEALEHTVADQTVELATLKQLNEEQKRLNGEQEKELTVLRRASSNYLGIASTAASVSRHGSSVYIKR